MINTTTSTITLPSDALTAGLKGSTWTVLVYLATHAPTPGVRSKELAAHVGLTDLSVRRALAKLEDRGWIVWRRHKGKREPLDLDLVWLEARATSLVA